VSVSEQAVSGASIPDSPYAWMRLAAAVVIGTIGSVGMWSAVVVVPATEAEFGVDRAAASLPFTLTMLGFAFGGVAMGWFADRFGILAPTAIGAASLALGYTLSGLAPDLWLFAVAHSLIGFASSATFGPLMSDISHWFVRRRGLAVTICSAGNYAAGTVWPPIIQFFVANEGLRPTQIGIGLFCAATMVPIALMFMRRKAPIQHASASGGMLPMAAPAALGLSSGMLQGLLCVAGVACCVAMSMPQVHLVAYCSDLGYGAKHGADMLAAMMGFGIISRVLSGVVADRIGGLATLLISSALQGVALFLYLPFDGLVSLYVISALFGLFQGGLVPMYAVVIREYFPPREAGTRLGLVLMATLFGMAFGGLVSGWIFDLTGSYQAAFINGVLWNFLNLAIIGWLMLRRERRKLAVA
jgi:MFS family permease